MSDPIGENWDAIAQWWMDDITSDPTYPHDVHPLLSRTMPQDPGRTLDLGCGEGQGMRIVGGNVFGADLSTALLAESDAVGRVVALRAPQLAAFRNDAFDTVYSIYLLDLLDDDEGFFTETARIVRPGGALVVIMNHPVYTAPGSAPLIDADGEVLWRWGAYFARGSSVEPVRERTVEFHHRPMGHLVSSAAAAGWNLEAMEELPLSLESIAAMPGYEGQELIPRLIGLRWALGA